MTLLLKANSSFWILLFAFIALINQLTKCHIPEELNLQQHYVKLKSCKVDITEKILLHFKSYISGGSELHT
jgi:hypothetical protein